MGGLTQDELKRQLHYDPLTGVFRWIVFKTLSVKIGDIAGFKRIDDYIEIKIYNRAYKAHRLAWLYTYGYFPENDIDHINRIRDDNRIINLREVSRQCNMRNKNTQVNNTSGIVGVCWREDLKKWRAQIVVNSKQIHLGFFEFKGNAAYARWNAEVKYNFPNCNTISTAYLYLKDLRNKKRQYDRF